MKDQILKPVITYLREQGATEDEIANTIAALIQAATVMLYQQAMETFSDGEMQQIENAPNDEAANQAIVAFCAKNMGKEPDELLEIFLKNFVEDFLAKKLNSN